MSTSSWNTPLGRYRATDTFEDEASFRVAADDALAVRRDTELNFVKPQFLEPKGPLMRVIDHSGRSRG